MVETVYTPLCNKSYTNTDLKLQYLWCIQKKYRFSAYLLILYKITKWNQYKVKECGIFAANKWAIPVPFFTLCGQSDFLQKGTICGLSGLSVEQGVIQLKASMEIDI